MIPTITAFEQSPDRGQGLARDMPVRWALEEVGQPYDVRLVSFSAMREGAHSQAPLNSGVRRLLAHWLLLRRSTGCA